MVDLNCCICGDNYPLAKIVSEIQPDALLSDLSPSEIEQLAVRMTDDARDPRDQEWSLRMAFALNGASATALFAAIRRRAPPSKGAEILRAAETDIVGLVGALNRYSENTTKLPYHLAAATGKLRIDADFEKQSRQLRDRLFTTLVEADPIASASRAAAGCPVGQFPRYVNSAMPWNVATSFSTALYQRPQDVGCHFRQGPFSGVISGFVCLSPVVRTMIVLQGWGGSLAANNNHFFYKWWPLVVLGLTPQTVQAALWARRF